MNKKAQGEIITTVLIILLVLAAIVIVWQVVNSTVQKGGKEVEEGTACMGINLVIAKAGNTTFTDTTTKNIIIRRDPGGPSDKLSVTLYVNDVFNKTIVSTLGELDSSLENIAGLSAGQKVQATSKVGTNQCPLGTPTTSTTI